jgi:hypothetical protein
MGRVTGVAIAALLVVFAAPASVHPGDVCVVLEGPSPTIGLVSAKLSEDAPVTGMSQAQLDRVARGDMQGTQIDSFGIACGADAWTEQHHWQGCGEIIQLTLSEGMYAFMADDDQPGVAPPMAVLEVVP